MRLARGTLILGAACALGGCGASNRDQVQAKVEQFVKATANRDYDTICKQILAPSLVLRLSAAGLGCQRAMQVFVGSVQDPTLSIAKITVNGQTASAITLTSARGQAASLVAIKLLDTGQGWRVSSLGSPAGG